MLEREDRPKPDTHPVPTGNYVTKARNYVTVSPSRLGNFVTVHIEVTGESSSDLAAEATRLTNRLRDALLHIHPAAEPHPPARRPRVPGRRADPG